MSLALGVLVSGNGTNLQAILDATADGSLAASVRCVISNKTGAMALERAARAGVPALTIPHTSFESREAFDRALIAALREHGAEWVVLAGFMRVLTPELLRAFPGRIVNIHPSLLPAFRGLKPQAQALAAKVAVSGCTVHHVVPELDAGPTIAQAEVPVLPDDTVETLSARILDAEHRLYPAALKDLLSAMRK